MSRRSTPMPKPSATVDAAELARFSALALEWWDESGAFRPLHRMNPVRLRYMRDRFAAHFERNIAMPKPFAGLTLLDIGCGGGLICEPLARLGFAVTGIDADPAALAVAGGHAAAQGLAIDYRETSGEDLATAAQRFDAVLALEVVEHSADPAMFLATAGELVKPGGAAVISTLNRTPKAFAAAIVGAEYLLRWLPRGTHDFKKFRRPSELARDLRAAGMKLEDIAGLVYDPWRDQWRLGRDIGVDYLLFASKAK